MKAFDTLSGLLRFFLWNAKLRIAKSMEYRFNFFLSLLISLGFTRIVPIVQYLVFTRVGSYPGWNLEQVILFQGFFILWSGIKDTLFYEVRFDIEKLVIKGELDRLLLKPYPSIGVLLAGGFSLNNLGSIIAGLAIIYYAVKTLSITVGLIQVSLVVFFWLCGLLLYMAALVIFCSVAVVTIYMFKLNELFDRLVEFGGFPVEIFSKFIGSVLVTIVPIAVWANFPARVLLNRMDDVMVMGSIACIMLFCLSLKVWDITMRKYTSAGG